MHEQQTPVEFVGSVAPPFCPEAPPQPHGDRQVEWPSREDFVWPATIVRPFARRPSPRRTLVEQPTIRRRSVALPAGTPLAGPASCALLGLPGPAGSLRPRPRLLRPSAPGSRLPCACLARAWTVQRPPG